MKDWSMSSFGPLSSRVIHYIGISHNTHTPHTTHDEDEGESHACMTDERVITKL